MPPLTSPYKSGSRHRSTSPLPPPLPPKAIDLNSSTRSTDKETGNKVTRRAFLCDIVVEREGEETTNLLQHFGRPLKPLTTLPPPPPPTTSRPATPSRLSLGPDNDDISSPNPSTDWTREKQVEMSHRLSGLVEELVRTERSYLMRIQALKKNYADPLRNFAKQEFSRIIPLYEAKTLFTNIDAIVPASAAFLAELERVWIAGEGEGRVGEICLRHFKDLKTMDPYRTYLSKQDESQKMFQEVLRKFPSFASYIERTKYQTTGMGNIGLRELLMEPVQRIPRYTLLWQTMMKCMSPFSTERVKLLEAIEIASRIAKCEPDAQTVRATVMYCLERNVDGFPANLFSNNRDYIDSIDVEDVPTDYPTSSSPGSRLSHSRPISTASASTSASTPSLTSLGSSVSSSQLPQSPPPGMPGPSLSSLHCTLFLFDDKLMIVKRQSSAISGRKVTGLDDVTKLVKSGGGVAVIDKAGNKKDKLSYRGIVDVLDVIAADTGNGDFHLFLEAPPSDFGDRWSSRPFRSYTTVLPPFSVSLDPVAVKRDKLRFIQNLWSAQALARARLSVKDARVAIPRVMTGNDEFGLEKAGEMFGRAKCYWNVWERNGFLGVSKKAKVVIQIDEDGDAPDLPLSDEGVPCMVLRLQPLSGGLCRFSFSTAGQDDDERSLIDYAEVPEKIITTVHRYGVFKFRTGPNSCPTTPSATGHRLRPAMLNLDAISRNLFGTGSISGRSGTASVTSSDMFSSTSRRSKSNMSRTSTMSLSISSGEEHKRLSRMSSSPSVKSDYEDVGDDTLIAGAPYKAVGHMGQSEVDLNERLDLARKNSKSVAALSPPTASGRLAAKSVAELRSRVEERVEVVAHGRLGVRSVGDLKGKVEVDVAVETLTVVEQTLRSGSPVPMSPTAPLRIRNKTPSPTKGIRGMDDTPKIGVGVRQSLPPIPQAGPSSVPVPNRPRAGPQVSYPAISDIMISPRTIVSPPPVRPSPISVTAPLSPRPHGPRSPGMGSSLGMGRPANPPVPGMGSSHTTLRVVSGNGRRVSPSRETVPLKGDDGVEIPQRPGLSTFQAGSSTPTPTVTPTPRVVSNKRQHSSDHLTPRKRSPSKSPAVMREDFGDENVNIDERGLFRGQMGDPLKVPSLSKRSALGSSVGGSRRSSGVSNGNTTPRRSSGPLTTPRTVSGATTSSVISTTTVESTVTEKTYTSKYGEAAKSEYGDCLSAVEAARIKIAESRALTKRLKAEVNSLRKQLNKDVSKERTRGLERNGSLPRSPQRRNINRLVDMDLGISHHTTNSKIEVDNIVLDEAVRGVASLVERLEGQLKAAIGDNQQAASLAERVAWELQQKDDEIVKLSRQVQMGKESYDLLRGQLGDVQTEVDVIYEAFNTELDGMFNDAQLPETEAFEAMRRDLQSTKSRRNALALENMKLKRDLEEANLKREQWARLLTEKGLL